MTQKRFALIQKLICCCQNDRRFELRRHGVHRQTGSGQLWVSIKVRISEQFSMSLVAQFN